MFNIIERVSSWLGLRYTRSRQSSQTSLLLGIFRFRRSRRSKHSGNSWPAPDWNRFADETLKKDRFFGPPFQNQVIAISTFNENLNRKLSKIAKKVKSTFIAQWLLASPFLSLLRSYKLCVKERPISFR